MALSEAQIVIVEQQWAEAYEHAEDVAKLFYGRLFETHPEVRLLFKVQDFTVQGKSSHKGLCLTSRA